MTAPAWTMPFAGTTSFPSLERPMFVDTVGSADPLRIIAYMAEIGFAGIQDNRLKLRPAAVQAAMGEALAKAGMANGCFVGNVSDRLELWASDDPDDGEVMKAEMLATVETAKRTGGSQVTLSPFEDPRKSKPYQLMCLVENLKRAAGLAEREGLVMCLEHVNPVRRPGTLLTDVWQCQQVVQAVGSPAVKMLFDVCHLQATNGDILNTFDICHPLIAAIQVADVPARRELGLGEINWPVVLRHFRDRGFPGMIELEYGCGGEGPAAEAAMLGRLRAIDDLI